ncbi:MAG: hypothetical protein K2I95_07600 [Treponemataceae bacterium]|nr:hypothetical protein [Treponemataceae bacterium]
MQRKNFNLSLFMFAALTLLPVAMLAAESETIIIKAPHTMEELNTKWDALKPVHTSGSPYITVPEMSRFDTMQTLGQVKGQVLLDGLNTLNFARYMAGMAGDVSMIADFIISAQFASALLAFRDRGLDHRPEKPYGISDEFYKYGYEGTSNSSLGFISTKLYESTGISTAVKGYLSDLGENNRNEAGHRCSALDPEMTGTGFGLATSRNGNIYSAMWTGYGVGLNGTGTKTTDYEAITWPAAGYHATDFYDNGMQWSVRLNRKRYDADKLGNIKVTVTTPNGTSVIPHKIGPYERMIIFTPTNNVKAGQKYTVEISGLYRKDKPVTLKYIVKFFDLSKPSSSDADLLAVDKLAIEHAIKEFSYVSNNYTRSKDLLNYIWAGTKYIDALQWASAPTLTKATSYDEGLLKGTLSYTYNGKSYTHNVNMSIPKLVTSDSAYKALSAAMSMTASPSTTKADVEKFINARVQNECTISISNFSVKAPTATETGNVSYNLTVKTNDGENLGTAGIVRVLPILGRKNSAER